MRQVFAGAALVVMMFAAQAAHASVFVWQDPKNDFTMSFPDIWRIQTEDTPNTVLRIAGPEAEDRETCSMKVIKDGRLQIYPKHLLDEAVKETLTRDFWDHETGQYKNANITDFFAPASLGNKGDATAVKFNFTEDTGNGKQTPMYGVQIGSIYGDDLFIAACSSTHDSYEQYAGVFASILDSVDLKSKYHPFPTGYYRNFLADPKVILPREKPGTTNAKLTSPTEDFDGSND